MSYKNLVYLTNARIPSEKANSVQIMKSCEAFVRQGLDVSLLIPDRIDALPEDPFRYYGVSKHLSIKKLSCLDLFPLKFIPRRIAFYIQSITFSLRALIFLFFHSYSRETIFYSRDYMTLFMLCFFGFPTVAEIHDYRSQRPHWAIGFVLQKAQAVILNSPGTQDALNRHYHLPSEKIIIVPNGVDISFFNQNLNKQEIRKELGIPEDTIVVGYVGRLETVGVEKGIPVLLEAFQKIKDERFVLYIVGGPEALVHTYQAHIAASFIEQKKIVFVGQVPYPAIPRYLAACDVMVIPLIHTIHSATTSPIKLFEYLAAGKAIVAADVPSLRHYLDEQTAVFFKAGDAEDLAQKIEKLATDATQLRGLSQKASVLARTYTWDKRAQRIIAFMYTHHV